KRRYAIISLSIGDRLMSLPRWDDDMKFELLRLKSELKPENFRVLHTPIGIGAVTKAPAPLHKKMKAAPAFSQEPRKPTRQPLAQKAAPSHERAPSARKPAAARRSSSGFFPSLARLLLA